MWWNVKLMKLEQFEMKYSEEYYYWMTNTHAYIHTGRVLFFIFLLFSRVNTQICANTSHESVGVAFVFSAHLLCVQGLVVLFTLNNQSPSLSL